MCVYVHDFWGSLKFSPVVEYLGFCHAAISCSPHHHCHPHCYCGHCVYEWHVDQCLCPIDYQLCHHLMSVFQSCWQVWVVHDWCTEIGFEIVGCLWIYMNGGSVCERCGVCGVWRLLFVACANAMWPGIGMVIIAICYGSVVTLVQTIHLRKCTRLVQVQKGFEQFFPRLLWVWVCVVPARNKQTFLDCSIFM